ncbi:hypothetical protein ACWDA3_56440 [Nonomuraea rubra]
MSTMSPPLRKLALTAHVTSSVGWLGAVLVFLALAIIGLTSSDSRTVRAVYLAMEPAAWYALVPLAGASLLTGVIQSLGTTWGLFRHYWVLFKLLINVGAVVVLLMYTETLRFLAGVAASNAGPDMLRSPSVLIHTVLAVVLLLLATVLAVYKPRGRTRHGVRTLPRPAETPLV